MNRWHEEWCVAPKVVVVQSDAEPRCDNCHNRPNVERLKSRIPAPNSTINPPPDEPLGRLNLSWPPTVPYGKPPGQDTERLVKTLQDTTVSDSTSMTAKKSPSCDTGERSKSYIYDRQLDADEFRLLVLEPSADENDPVHVTLEIYRDDDCPEYETVSYTWGGEEDDAAPCQPVYIGPGWEVMFQTKNCHAMLCHLRPKRGLRLLWVDALCINQVDMTERGAQVAKMGNIYGSARRVVVFLGPDIITPLPLKTNHPARRGLEELARDPVGHSDKGLKSVLRRRYFGRIWMVQELLLSRELIMRIWDKEYIANCGLVSLIRKQNPHWDWGSTAAPWLSRLSQGRGSAAAAHLLRLAAGCAASDPRDLVFGLLGLLPAQWALKADYSLSARHVHVGFLAHCLLHCRDATVFQFAGRRDLTCLPSWTHPIGTGSREAEWLELRPKRPRIGVLLGFNADSDGEDSGDDSWNSDEEFYHSLKENNFKIPDNHSWWNSANIDPMDGSLTIKLVHFMPILVWPSMVVDSSGFTFYTFEPPDGHELRLEFTSNRDHETEYSTADHGQSLPVLFNGIRLVCQTGIDTTAIDWIPGRDHIFILSSQESEIIPLVLREVPNNPGGYRLVLCGHRLDMMFRLDHGDSIGGFVFSQLFGVLSETVSDRLQLMRDKKPGSVVFDHVTKAWLAGGWSFFFDSTKDHKLCVDDLWRHLMPKPPPFPPGFHPLPPSQKGVYAPEFPVTDAFKRRALVTSSISRTQWWSYRGTAATSRSAEEYLSRLNNRYTLMPTEAVRFCVNDFYEGRCALPKDSTPAAPDWPENIVDAYHIDGGVYEVTIF